MSKYELALVVNAKIEDEGYYYFIQFDAETEVPAVLEEKLRITENVLRYLVVKQDA